MVRAEQDVLSSGDFPIGVVLRDGARVILRRTTLDDAQDLIEIQRQVIDENVANVDDRVDSIDCCRQKIAASDPASLWLAAEAESHVVGSMRLLAPAGTYLRHIRNLYIEIHRDWRSRGVGTTLLKAGISWAAANHLETVALSVLDSNPLARALYERLGFVITGHTPALVKRPDGSYTDDTQMILRIPQPQ